MAMCGDVSNQDIVNRFVEEVINKYGRVDVLVNNAGMRFRKKFAEIRTPTDKSVWGTSFSAKIEQIYWEDLARQLAAAS